MIKTIKALIDIAQVFVEAWHHRHDKPWHIDCDMQYWRRSTG